MTHIDIQCLCGSVAAKLTGTPIVQAYCHCRDCQTAHSAAYIATAAYPSSSVEVIAGKLMPLVIKTAPRMRCPECGTFLYTEIEAADLRSVNAALLPKGLFKPQFHLHCQDAVMPVVDDLPHFKDLPGAFGGSNDTVTW